MCTEEKLDQYNRNIYCFLTLITTRTMFNRFFFLFCLDSCCHLDQQSVNLSTNIINIIYDDVMLPCLTYTFFNFFFIIFVGFYKLQLSKGAYLFNKHMLSCKINKKKNFKHEIDNS